MSNIAKPGTEWNQVYTQCVQVAPEAFHEDRLLNYWAGRWQRDGASMPVTSPVDGSTIAGPPRLGQNEAAAAVRATVDAHRSWRDVPPATRGAKVHAALDEMQQHRDLMALLLVWEIGKRGAFVGGELLVQAVTQGPPDERPYGNFPSYSLYPPT